MRKAMAREDGSADTKDSDHTEDNRPLKRAIATIRTEAGYSLEPVHVLLPRWAKA